MAMETRIGEMVVISKDAKKLVANMQPTGIMFTRSRLKNDKMDRNHAYTGGKFNLRVQGKDVMI
jgi:hypothetical protein